MTTRVLIVDDEKLVAWSLRQALTEEGYVVDTCATGTEARAKFNDFSPQVVLLDIRLPDANGLELLQEFKENDEDTIIIMITAYADADSAVEALKDGADDFIGKPFDLDKIRLIVAKALEKRRLEKQVDYFKDQYKRRYTHDQLIGNSPAMIQVFKMIKICAESDIKCILIQGESGTGKELVARSIHFHSPRSDAPFIELNCAAIPEHLIENELFGHEKGAYTHAESRQKGIFEAAEGGTVFLDEIGDMPLHMQAKILKIIETRRFRRLGGVHELDSDVRIIAATNQDLEAMVAENRFRGDLYFRLNVINITLPPLRERLEDIPVLANYFLDKLNEEHGRGIQGISQEALECLKEYNWPGNVRELKNAIERAYMLEQEKVLTARVMCCDLKPCPGKPELPKAQEPVVSPDGRICLPEDGISIMEVEKELIRQALERFRGNQTKAARFLGMTRDSLRYRMKKYELR